MIAAALVVIYDPVVTSYSRGHGKWFAQFYDAATANFYAGTGDTAWSAIAWAFDEYMTRGVLKVHRIAVSPEEKPGAFYARVTGPIEELIERSSVGRALADVKERGIDAHLVDPEPVKAPRVGCFALKLDEAEAARTPRTPPKSKRAPKKGAPRG